MRPGRSCHYHIIPTMNTYSNSFDGDAFAVLLKKEETEYRPKTYLWSSSPSTPKVSTSRARMSSRKRPLLDSVPLHQQQAAMEECVSFIDSLSYDHAKNESGSGIGTAEDVSGDSSHSSHARPTLSRRLSIEGKSPSSVTSRALFSSLRIINTKTKPSKQRPRHHRQSEGGAEFEVWAEWRSKMVNWSQEIVSSLGLETSCIELAFCLFDRYLATRQEAHITTISRETFQLYSITLLYTSIKLYSSKTLSVDDMVNICGGIYDKKDIESAELHILEALGWKLCPPLASSFVGYLLALVPVCSSVQRKRLLQRSLDVIDVAIADSSLVGEKQSNIAVASVVVAAMQADELVGSMEPYQIENFLENVEGMTTIQARSDETFSILLENLLCSAVNKTG